MFGIVGFGAYVPRYRIRTAEIAAQWGREADGSGLVEKTVPGLGEDAITISVEAARHALARAAIDPKRVGALYVGSESHPYAVKPSGTVVAEALGIGPDVHVADFEFACKAGTEAMFCALSHVKAEQMDFALAIGADTSQGAPADPLEYTASAGGAGLLFGRGGRVGWGGGAAPPPPGGPPPLWRRRGGERPDPPRGTTGRTGDLAAGARR